MICALFFFFNDTATTEIYTLSLHDALPIFNRFAWDATWSAGFSDFLVTQVGGERQTTTQFWGYLVNFTFPSVGGCQQKDRKSTRLNSSHANISYAVFCLKKKK